MAKKSTSKKASKRSSSKKSTKKKASKKKAVKKTASKTKPVSSSKIVGSAGPRRKHKYHTHIRIGVLVFAILAVILIIATVANYDNLGEQGDAVATVNGEAILQSEVDEQMDKIPAEYAGLVTEDVIIEQLVNEKILLQEADAKGVVVTDEELDQLLEVTMVQLGMSEEDLNARLAEQGLSVEEFRALYTKQLKITKLVEQEVLPNIDVSDEALQEFYDSRVRARHILVTTEAEAEAVIERLNAGEDFGEVAAEVSQDPGSTDGELGEFGKGQMVPEFEAAVYALDINEVTQEPVKTQFGYHIIQREPRLATFEESKEDITSALQQQSQTDAITEYVQELRAVADIQLN